MKYHQKFILAISAFFIAFTGISHAATKGRILTDNSVTIHKNGSIIATYTEQAPLDENALIACDGTCMVKMKGLSLVGVDQSIFAVKDSAEAINLYVQSGKIHFAIADTSRRFIFYGPDGNFFRTEGFVSEATSGSSVKGYMQVTDKSLKIGMDDGTMLVMTKDGTRDIGPGQSIVLAMAEVPVDEDEDNNPGGGFILDWSSLSTAQQAGLVAFGAGIAYGIAELTFLDSGESTLSAAPPPAAPPGTPPGSPPPPGSPNQ